MVLHLLVGLLAAHVHVEPQDFLVVGAEDEVVALWVNANTGNPLGSRLVFVYDRLLLKVVLEDDRLRASEEVRLRGMESDCLDDAFSRAERFLRRSLADAVDQHLGSRLDVVGHRCEVVTLRVPEHFADHVFQSQRNHVLFEFPLCVEIFRFFRRRLNPEDFLRLLEELFGCLIDCGRA